MEQPFLDLLCRWFFVYFPKFDIYDPYSYGHLPLISTYNPFMEYNPIYNQL